MVAKILFALTKIATYCMIARMTNITPQSCRAGRALLNWSQTKLAENSNLSMTTIRDYESGRRVPGINNLAAMQRAMEDRGVRFIADCTEIGALISLEKSCHG